MLNLFEKFQKTNVFMKQILSVLFILISMADISVAQNLDLGSWNILNLKYNIDEKWSVFGEAQLRSLKFYDDFHYYEYKGGINYKAHKNATLSLGAGSYQTYKEGGSFVLLKITMSLEFGPKSLLFSRWEN